MNNKKKDRFVLTTDHLIITVNTIIINHLNSIFKLSSDYALTSHLISLIVKQGIFNSLVRLTNCTRRNSSWVVSCCFSRVSSRMRWLCSATEASSCRLSCSKAARCDLWRSTSALPANGNRKKRKCGIRTYQQEKERGKNVL